MKTIQIGKTFNFDDVLLTPLELCEINSFGDKNSYFASGKKQVYALLFCKSDKVFALDLSGKSIDIDYLCQKVNGLSEYLERLETP